MITGVAIFNRKNKLDKSGKGLIEIRITIERKPHHFGTGFKIYPEHWDKRNNRVNIKCLDHDIINARLVLYLQDIDSIAIKAVNDKRNPTYEEIKQILKPDRNHSNNFIDVIQNEIYARVDLKESTRMGHLGQLEKLKEFKPMILIEAINYQWVVDFDQWMARENLSLNTRWKYHKFLKTYINSAIKKGVIEKSPYAQFKTSRTEGNRDALTLQELKTLEDLDRKNLNTSENITLDKFLFSCYTGLRISDIEKLKLNHFIEEKTSLYLTIKMEKTSTVIRNMPLHKLFNGKAIEIFKKYENSKLAKDELLFPEMNRNEINKHLKVIANVANIEKNITFHMARHTFGSSLAELTGNVLLIKTLMGHSKIETSMIYIHMSRQRIDNMLDNVKFEY